MIAGDLQPCAVAPDGGAATHHILIYVQKGIDAMKIYMNIKIPHSNFTLFKIYYYLTNTDFPILHL